MSEHIDRFLAIMSESEFEIVLQKDFSNQGEDDKFFIFWNKEHGILCAVDTFWNKINRCCFYFQCPYRKNVTAGLYGNTQDGGSSSFKDEIYNLSYHAGVFTGFHNKIISKITFIKSLNCLPVWQNKMHVWLCHHGDTKDNKADAKSLYNYNKIIKERYDELPEEVRNCIKISNID